MPSTDALLWDVVIEVGEEMAMLLPAMPPDADAGADAEDALAPLRVTESASMRVAFQGPWNGEVLVTCAGQVPKALAANMLGAEEDPDPGLVRDACAEFANVICGNLLPRLAGRGPVFTLNAPQEVGTATPVPGHGVCGRARVEFEEGPVEIVLALDAIGQTVVGALPP